MTRTRHPVHFQTHQPSRHLIPYVESILYFKHFCPDHSIERVIPDGRVHLIFELDGFERVVYHNDSLVPKKHFSKTWLSGMHKNYISISAHQQSEMLVVQFKPGGAAPFLPFPVCDINDRVMPAKEIFGPQVLELHSILKHSSDEILMFDAMEEFLTKQACFDEGPARQLVEKLLSAIESNSSAALKGIIQNSAYSQKQAIHLFKKQVGLNPKSYQRIVRFTEILAQVKQRKTVSWSKIGPECSYYDQSHFIREFRAFSGYSPQEFLVEQGDHPEANFFPLD